MKRTWKHLAALLLACMLLVSLPATLAAAQDDTLSNATEVTDGSEVSGSDSEAPAPGTSEPAAPGTETSDPGSTGSTGEPAPGSGSTDGGNGAGEGVPQGDASVEVTPGSPEELEDLKTANVVVDLYPVAIAQMNQSGTPNYTMVTPFEEFWEMLDAVLNADNAEDGAKLLADMARRVALSSVDFNTPDGHPAFTVKPQVTGAKTDEKITDLPLGLYLVVARNGDGPYADTAKYPYLYTETDEAGQVSIVSRVRTEQYIYTYRPQLVFIPNARTESGWDYDAEMTLKPERDDNRVGKLEIVKTLTNFVEGHNGFFVFEVKVMLNGSTEPDPKYSGIYTLTFDAAGRKSIVIEDLPEGAQVTVTEVYDGASYTLSSQQVQNGVIPLDDTLQLPFENRGSTGEGGAIVNHFENGSGGWKHIPETVVE